ncbi:MAG: HAMP domain-containing protein [Chloroflexi bacterium]|nr:HAMP domain-containing protein [Chloroflexota bacterium]
MAQAQTPRRLANRVTLTFSLAIAFLLLIVAALYAFIVYTNQGEAIATLQREVALRAALTIETHLDALFDPLRDAVRSPLTTNPKTLLDELLARNEAYLELAWVDDQGRIVASAARAGHHIEPLERDADLQSAWRAAKRGESYLSAVHLKPQGQEPYVVKGIPLEQNNGALVAWLDQRHVWKTVSETRVGETGYAYLLNSEGVLIAYRDSSRVLAQRNLVTEIAGLRAHLKGANDTAQYTGLSGVTVIGSHASIENTGWIVVVETPLTEAYRILLRSVIFVAALFVVGIVVAILLARYLTRRLLEPIELLQEGVGLIAQGHLDHTIVIETGDEIEELADEFNHMTRSLRRARDENEAWTREMEQRVEERSNQIVQQKQLLAVLEERQRIARELHDSVTQSLFTMTMNLDAARALLTKDASRVPALLDRLRRIAQTAQSEMRALILHLRPSPLAQNSLVDALRDFLSDVSIREKLKIDFQADGHAEMPPSCEDAVIRIAQEAVNNAVKHAGATRLIVQLKNGDGKTMLSVQDDGKGFDPAGEYMGHLGLKTMRERAEALGGKVTIESAIGTGTMVRAVIPSGRDET